MPDISDLKNLLPAGKKARFPQKVKPMLATLVNEPFYQRGWMYEVKWDGYRAIAFVKNGKVELASRNSKSFNDKFYPIYQELQTWKMATSKSAKILRQAE